MQMDNKGKVCKSKIKIFPMWNRKEKNGHKGGLWNLKKVLRRKTMSIVVSDMAMYEGYS